MLFSDNASSANNVEMRTSDAYASQHRQIPLKTEIRDRHSHALHCTQRAEESAFMLCSASHARSRSSLLKMYLCTPRRRAHISIPLYIKWHTSAAPRGSDLPDGCVHNREQLWSIYNADWSWTTIWREGTFPRTSSPNMTARPHSVDDALLNFRQRWPGSHLSLAKLDWASLFPNSLGRNDHVDNECV